MTKNKSKTNDEKNLTTKNETNQQTLAWTTPKADILETHDGLNITVDLPGVEQEGLKVQVENNILTIEGKTSERSDKSYILREFETSNFFRQFELTDAIAQDKIQAKLQNGELLLTLPQAENLKPREIKVKIN